MDLIVWSVECPITFFVVLGLGMSSYKSSLNLRMRRLSFSVIIKKVVCLQKKRNAGNFMCHGVQCNSFWI